jgi:hypothetical protein
MTEGFEGSLRANLFQNNYGNGVINHRIELCRELRVLDSEHQDEKL